MKPTRLTLAIIVCIFFQCNLTQAQIQQGELVKGKTVSMKIAPKDRHQYLVDLDKNQLASFVLMQEGVDMMITTYSPQGEKIEDFDSPNGKSGPELFTITTNAKGKYRIEVYPFNENEPEGPYTIAIKDIRPRATTLNGKVDELFALWDNKDTPGASVAVVKNGAIVYTKGYGMANLEYDIPNSPTTVFHIASVSKQFTVFSILLLEKEGKLSLDDDIRKYIPEVPDFGKTITLRHLATHTSGLRDQWNLLSMAGWRMDDVITKEHILKMVSRQKELNFNPGDEYTYCNTGFTLLAEVVARMSGQSFAAFTQAHIFGPLKMKNTLFYDDHEKIVKNRAYSYYTGDGGYKKSVLSYANVGATSLFTTAEDLSLWALNFWNPKVGDTTIINKMNTLAVLNNGKTFGGAMGQFVGKYKGLNQIQHDGADAGYRAQLTRFPDENFAVIVLSNAAEFNPGKLATQITDIYLADKLVSEPVKAEKKEEKPQDAIAVDAAILQTYVGDYELRPGFVISITENNNQLTAQATGQQALSLVPTSATQFMVQGVEAMIEFVPNGGDKVGILKLHQGGQIQEAKRVKAFDKTSVQLSDFSGNFYSEELATTYEFVVVDDKLIAKHSRLSDFELNPVKTDVFSSTAWFFGMVEFIRDENNAITGFRVSNDRVRKLYFKKVDTNKKF